MAKQFFPLLPKLKEASAINPDKASAWEDESRDFLNALIKNLAVSGTIKDIGHIDSIPDVWARPLLFQMALFDEQASGTQQFIQGLHERVRGEWRCILAMLALKDMKRLDLRAEAVHIGEEASSLGKILLRMAPRESIQSSTTTWEDLYVLFYQDIPIAMTSPTTLVAAAADYQTAFNGDLTEPWSEDGYTLTDPTNYLPEDDRTVLHAWISNLHHELRSKIPLAEQENNPVFLNILHALDEYRQDVARKCPHPLRTDVSLANAKLNLNLGIFRLLNQTVQAKQASAEDSAVRLVISSKRNPDKSILLVSPGMVRTFAEQMGIPATQLVIWAGLSANDILESHMQDDRKNLGRISLGTAEWRSPEDFFLDRMTVMEPGNAISGSLPIAGAQMLAEDDTSVILPFKQELLEYFTAQEIAERTSLENTPEDICVSFSFPLSGIHGHTEDFRYTMHYPKKDLIYLQTNVPVIEIWPNLRREGWKKYYLYYENVAAQNESSQEVGKDFFYVDPWAYGEDINANVPARGLANRYTAKLTGFPEALLCTVNQEAPIPAGLLLLTPPPRIAKEAELSWKLGIDFGTSSTMLYYRENSKPPHPLSFEPHLFQVTDSAVQRLSTFVNFIPSSMEGRNDGSFLSIFHMLNTEAAKREIQPLQDGHVYLLTTHTTEQFKEQGNRIDANLKWKDDSIGRRKVTAYIKQICIQSAAEAALRGVDKLEWNFSFPTAFSKEQQFAFKATCQDAVAEAYHDTCFGSTEGESIESWPESKASAYFFNKLGQDDMLGQIDTNFSDGAICLDIGAGTTDISIISGQPGRIIYHTSIQFAGRYLFLPIYRNYGLFSQDPLPADDTAPEQKQAIIDADLREHSEDYLRNLKTITGRKEVKRVLQLSQLSMAGIFYYLGNILSVLRTMGMYKEDHVPDIFVGGNGSRIFSWLAGGSFDTANPFLDVLKNMIRKSSGLSADSRFRINLSHNPKIEVACGMIETKPHNDSDFFDEERQARELFGTSVDDDAIASVIAGEACSIRNEKRDAHAMMSARDISDGVHVKHLKELDHFLTLFNQARHLWSAGIDISEDDRYDIRKLVNSYYVSETGKDSTKIFVEPIFIIALKKLMERLAK